MGNATKRREKRDALRLQALARREPDQFRREWERRLSMWLGEVAARARAARDGASPQGRDLRVFGVLQKAERMLALCGSEEHRIVGPHTLDVLRAECARAVAGLVDPRLYKLGNTAGWVAGPKGPLGGGCRPPDRL